MFNPLDDLEPREAVRRIVAAGQCALPLSPAPTPAQIDNVLKRLQTAFEIPTSIRMAAQAEWEARVSPLHIWHRYRTTLRPAAFGGLPAGVNWRYVEAPSDSVGHVGLPRSRHLYGVIETTRELTPEELDHFSIKAA